MTTVPGDMYGAPQDAQGGLKREEQGLGQSLLIKLKL